ncbi:MAG: PhzF family phenazine biosynthesis protein [Burkholderiales bacterium]
MRLRYHVLDVFTDRAFGGNPLAVVFDGERLDGGTMQAVAAEFNLSETVFVLTPTRSSATRRIRIFTPRTELPFAGHPTVGTAFLLATLGECDLAVPKPAIVLEEAIGDVHVAVHVGGGVVLGTQMSVPKMPESGPEAPPAAGIAQMLSLTAADLHPGIRPQSWSCGLPFLFVALKDVEAVRRAALRHEIWVKLLERSPAANVFVFALGAASAHADLHARMFAPAFGIPEDPATGAAVSALAGCIASGLPDGRHAWVVEQGVEMGRPSRLELECERTGGKFVAVRVGGPSVRISEGVMCVG